MCVVAICFVFSSWFMALDDDYDTAKVLAALAGWVSLFAVLRIDMIRPKETYLVENNKIFCENDEISKINRRSSVWYACMYTAVLP